LGSDEEEEQQKKQASSSCHWPNLTPILKKLRKIAPPKPNHSSLKLKMVPGDDPTYDALVQRQKEVTKQMENFKNKAGKELRCQAKYFGKNKNSWQLEVSGGVGKKESEWGREGC